MKHREIAVHFKTGKYLPVKTFVLTAVFFWSGLALAWDAEFNIKRNWQENYSIDSSLLTEKKLVVDITSGFIKVTGYDGSEINVLVDIHWWGKQEPDLVLAGEELQLIVEQSSNGYLIFLETPFRERSYGYFRRSRNYSFRYDVTLQVPRNLGLELYTVMRGDIQLSGVSGDIKIENVRGDILLDSVHATGSVKTISGDILLGFKQTPDLDLSLYSRFGDVFCTFDYEIIPDPSPLTVVREGNLTRYIRDYFSNIRIARGGMTIKLESLSGDIIIQDKPI